MRAFPLLLVLLVGGCSKDDSKSEPSWNRAAFRPVGERPDVRPRETARFAADDVTAAWRIAEGGRVDEAVARTDGADSAVVLTGSGARLVEIRAPLLAADLARCDLRVDVPEGEVEVLRLAFWLGDRTRAYSEVLTLEGAAGSEHVELELAQTRGLVGGFDRIVLESAGQASRLAFHSLAFEAQPPIAELPTAFDGPALVPIGDDSRRGVAVDPRHPLALTVDAPLPGTFEFSYRVGTAEQMGDAVLVVEGLDAGPERLVLGDASRVMWRVFRCDSWIPSAGTLRIAMEGGAPGAFTLVADAGVRCGSAPDEESEPRTVVLITSDTHRGELLGVTSGGLVATPMLDALASRAPVFVDARSTSNATNPSHVALMTGLHPRDSRIVTNRDPVAERASTLAERFSAAGWRTAGSFSAFHLGHPTSGLGQGFDRYDGPGAPTGDQVDAFAGAASAVRDGAETVARAMAQMDDASGAPLFLWVHLFDPHTPYDPPGEFDGRYVPPGREKPADFHFPTASIPGFLRDIRDVDEPWEQYRALVDYVDHIVTPLLQRPRVESGVIAFTSDHGEAFGEHGIWWNHAGLYPATTRVPLLLAWPGSTAATVTAPVRQADVGRTLLALAGLESDSFPGRDLRWALDEPGATEPRFALAYHGRQASVDDGRWLLVLHLVEEVSDDHETTWQPGQVELFDRRSDPEALKDVVDAHVGRARAMRARLLQWLAAGDPEGYKGDFKTKAAIDGALEALGYASGSEASGKWYDPDRWGGRPDAFLERYGER